jgi:hypothetical protein
VKMVSFVFFAVETAILDFGFKGEWLKNLDIPSSVGQKWLQRSHQIYGLRGLVLPIGLGPSELRYTSRTPTYINYILHCITLYTLHDIAVQYIILHTVDTVHTTHIGHRVH